MRPLPQSLMLFAAGLGTRMRPLTDTLPKPLIRVGDRPLIDHALALAEDAGIARIVVNTHYRADQIAAHLVGRNVVLSHEPEILETGGGLRAALPLLVPRPVYTLNSDVVWTGPNPLKTLGDQWREEMGALLVLVPADRATGHSGKGDFALSPDGRITRGGPLVYACAQILRPEGMAAIPDRVFSLNRYWDMLIAEGRAFGTLHPGGWADVGRPENIALAEALLDV